MNYILNQIKITGCVKITTLKDWNTFIVLPFNKLTDLCCVCIDNSSDNFIIDYDFINKIGKISKHNGFGELNITDISNSLTSLNFLRNLYIDQLYISAPNINFTGFEDISGIKMLFFLSENKNIDISVLSTHKEMITLFLGIPQLNGIKGLKALSNLSTLGLEAKLTNIDFLYDLDCCKLHKIDNLLLQNNSIDNINVLKKISALNINLDNNRICDISSIPEVIKYNLQYSTYLNFSIIHNPIKLNDKRLILNNNYVETEIKNRNLSLNF